MKIPLTLQINFGSGVALVLLFANAVVSYLNIQKLRDNERAQSQKLPAIALTAYASQEDKNQVLAAGFEIYLPKPVAPVELVSAISSLVSS